MVAFLQFSLESLSEKVKQKYPSSFPDHRAITRLLQLAYIELNMQSSEDKKSSGDKMHRDAPDGPDGFC